MEIKAENMCEGVVPWISILSTSPMRNPICTSYASIGLLIFNITHTHFYIVHFGIVSPLIPSRLQGIPNYDMYKALNI